jgi:hypothetical protein
MKNHKSAATPEFFLTTSKEKAARFNSPDDAVKFGTTHIVKAGGMSKVVKVDGSFGEVSDKPQVALEITAVSSIFSGNKTIKQLDVPHYVMDTAAGVEALIEAEAEAVVPMSKRL